VDGTISADFQYRIRLDTQADGVPDVHLKYNDGKVTGLANLVVTVNADGKGLTFSFPLADVGLVSGDHILWWSETQAGVKATQETGIVDNMPDSGFFGYVLR